MFKIKRPKKDTTILSDLPCENRGLDEVLQLKTVGGELPVSPTCDSSFLKTGSFEFKNNYPPSKFVNKPNATVEDVVNKFYPTVRDSGFRALKSRVLMKWSIEDWIQLVSGGSGVEQKDHDVFLKMYHTQSQKLPISYDLEFYPIESKDTSFGTGFKQGDGREGQNRSRGASWIFKDAIQNKRWNRPGGDFLKKDKNGNQTYVEKRYDFEDPDINLSIKNVFDYWKKHENNGLLIKFSKKVEDLKSNNFGPGNLTDPAELFFFGSLSHTIYKPELLLGFDDHEWNTSGADMLLYKDRLKLTISNLEDEFYEGEKIRLRVNVTERYQNKKYLDRDNYHENKRTPKFLPEGSLMYSIEDKIAGKTIVPFSKYSQLSFDPNGYYFDLDLTNFYPERTYEIKFKFDDPVGDFEEVYDNRHKFKVK